MNYQETLDYLYSRLPLFSRVGAAAYKADLTNTIKLCDLLGNPHKKFKCVHVAGTNGKGSVSHMLAAIYQQAGYKTGLYTSPHLKDFRERIRINGEMIDKEFVVTFTDRMKDHITAIQPSFFEITVAMAFDYFANEETDIAIIETGLGGRLDSTNVITPELSVITNIGFDHMNLLGNTLEQIAFEKAGIIKYGIPVVVGESNGITDPVFLEIAERNRAPITFAPTQRHALSWHWENGMLEVEIAKNESVDHENYLLDLPGIYQVKNIVTVLTAIDILQQHGWKITHVNVVNGLKQVKKTTGLHGRWELVHQHPTIVMDVAHNEDGIRQLLQQVELTDHHELRIVIGLVNDKEIEKILSLLPVTANYYFTQAKIPRALDAKVLGKKAAENGLHGVVINDVNEAVRQAKQDARKNDLVIICGSVFVVGEVELPIK